MPPGSPRYVIEGTGAVLFPVEVGDRISVTHDEGGQPCEILYTDPNAQSDPLILGVNSIYDAEGIKALLASADRSLRSLRMGLDGHQNCLPAVVVPFAQHDPKRKGQGPDGGTAIC